MNDQFPQEHVNTWENNQFRPDSVITPEPVQYQPDNVITAQTDQNQPEVNTLENEHFYDKPIETPVVTAEAVQDTGSPQEKTEPWKQTYVPVSTFTPTPPPAPAAQPVVNAASPEMLFGSEETKEFRARWNEVQAKFVDEPGCSVREADTLVADVMAQITQMFAKQRSALESQWSKGDTSTEDLRQVLQHYRSFFNRLLK